MLLIPPLSTVTSVQNLKVQPNEQQHYYDII